MEEVGSSIFLTTLTSTLAFSLGLVSSIPVVNWLYLYAFPTILINFFYCITWFVALVVIDENRMQQNRVDCCVCFSAKEAGDGEHSQDTPEKTSSVADQIMTRYSELLLKPVVKLGVCVGFLALLGCMAWQTSLLEQYFDFTDLTPSDSYIKPFIDTLNDYTDLAGAQPGVYFRFEDQSGEAIQSQMDAFVNELVGIDEITKQPTYFWLRAFQDFVDDSEDLQDLTFNEQVGAFLNDEVNGGLYKNDIVLNAAGDVTASRTYLYMDNVDMVDVKSQIDALANQRAVTEAQPINADTNDWSFFTFADDYYIWEFYTVAVSELIQSTWLGVLSVTVVFLFFIPHWTAAFIVCFFISMLYIDLLGVLNLAGVSINTVSYITLVLSIGLMVDFIMHVLMRYYEAYGTREQKVKETLMSMGSSIFVGAISTFLGTLPLAFSTSEIMKTVFVAFVGLVTLGAGHGLILLPVLLSMFGTEECIREGESASENIFVEGKEADDKDSADISEEEQAPAAVVDEEESGNFVVPTPMPMPSSATFDT